MSALFMLDCCKPRSKQIDGIKTLMSRLTKDSPHYRISLQVSTLLGLLEKDFSNVPAISTQALWSHIEDTGIQFLGKAQALHPILSELHDLGLLLLVHGKNSKSSSTVHNPKQFWSRHFRGFQETKSFDGDCHQRYPMARWRSRERERKCSGVGQ